MQVKVTNLPDFRPSVKDGNNNMFSNWVWVERNKLARSSAPYYSNDDKDQIITESVADYLASKLINLVVSLNHHRLCPDHVNKLIHRGILYHHIPVPDYHAPSKDELIDAATRMENKISLVWCGYGQGRTGTMVTAWEILTGRKDKVTAIDLSSAEKDVQKVVLDSLPERQLALFLCDLCQALRQYKRSRTKGVSFGLGRTASLFGARKASDASVNIATALENMLEVLSINLSTYGAPVNEVDLLNCGTEAAKNAVTATLKHIRQFVEWAAGLNTDPGIFGRALNMGSAPGNVSGPAGATLRNLLRTAITSFDARRIQANNDKLL
jgi:protein-tyrosine phosphatase